MKEMNKIRQCLFFILVLLLLSGCQDQEAPKEHSKSTDERNQEVVEDEKAIKEAMEFTI